MTTLSKPRLQRLGGISISLGHVGRVATQGLLLLSFGRFGGPESAGQFAVSLAATTPVFLLFSIALKDVVLTHAAPPRNSTSLWAAMILFASAATFSLTLEYIAGFVGSLAMIGGVAALKVLEGCLDVCYSQLLRSGKTSTVAGYLWANTAATFLAIALALALWNPLSALYASALVSIVALGVLSTKTLPNAKGHPSASAFRGILRPGFRLAGAQALSASSIYIPIYFLSIAGSPKDAGLFASAYYSVTVSNIVFVGLQQFAMSRMVRTRHQDLMGLRFEERKFARELLVVASLLAAGVFLLLPPVLPLIFGQKFAATYTQSALLAGAVLILAALSWAIAVQLVRNRYGDQMLQVAIALALSASLAWLLHEQANVESALLLVLVALSTRLTVATIQLRLTSAPSTHGVTKPVNCETTDHR